jgi:hypothetical protein
MSEPQILTKSPNSSGNSHEAILKELGDRFAKHRAVADRKASRSRIWAPTLAVIAAVGSAFAGAAVATTGLTAGWKTAIIVVAFFSTGVAAGAAALRPTERAQTAAADLANARALCAWVEFLDLQERRSPIDDSEFNRAVNWLQTWRIHQLRPEPYASDGRLPWVDSTAAPASSAAEEQTTTQARGRRSRRPIRVP